MVVAASYLRGKFRGRKSASCGILLRPVDEKIGHSRQAGFKVGEKRKAKKKIKYGAKQ
jgi:hypothetical protein